MTILMMAVFVQRFPRREGERERRIKMKKKILSASYTHTEGGLLCRTREIVMMINKNEKPFSRSLSLSLSLSLYFSSLLICSNGEERSNFDQQTDQLGEKREVEEEKRE